ncbi:MAG: DNA polymerase III subunit [Deltaproteobacteria bacterium]|jgi:DNA polymerase III delta' subunit|nr:DNA polymerase III subunit [Deltaproteobacteria bacterium]
MPWSLIGAGQAKRSLGGMIKRGRLPHAVLVTGPKGGGKKTFALDLARAVNCQNPDEDGSPCGVCLSCRKIEHGNHPDVSVLSPRGRGAHIPVELVRELRESLNFVPYEGNCKVSLILSAEALNTDSGGALLKTLEEPAPRTLIILTAVAPTMILGTLRSRCVNLKIPPLSRLDLSRVLKEKRGLRGPAAALLSGLSRGALGRAMEIDVHRAAALWGSLEKIFGESTRAGRLRAAGDLSRELAEEISQTIKEKTVAGEEDLFDIEIVDLFEAAVRLWFRDAGVLNATAAPALLEGPPPGESMIRFARTMSPAAAAAAEEAVTRLLDVLSRFIRADLAFQDFWLSVL